MIEIFVGILVLLSATMVLIASVGIVRFKNLYARMHVVTKVSSFALLLLLIALNILSRKLSILVESLLIFHVLIFMSPISAHVIAKVALWLKTDPEKVDEDSDNSFTSFEK
jgi:multicomponent Na+:H+ antiporter subunit G